VLFRARNFNELKTQQMCPKMYVVIYGVITGFLCRHENKFAISEWIRPSK